MKIYPPIFAVYGTFLNDPEDNWELIDDNIFKTFEDANDSANFLKKITSDNSDLKYVVCKLIPQLVNEEENYNEQRILTL